MRSGNKIEFFELVESRLLSEGLTISHRDMARPWGGFFAIDEGDAEAFAVRYFGTSSDRFRVSGGKLSPKILVVAPGKRLSWQYHHRRAEVWKVLEGEVGVVRSDDDEEKPYERIRQGQTVTLKQGERHRLIGLENWSVLAEIWQHTDIHNPSNEEDIVRVQDDFGRNS